MSILKSTWIFIFVILLLVFPGRGGNTDKSHLPHRDALATDVKFWKKVFAELSLDQYIIHDSQDLSKIYKTVTFDSSVSARQQEKELKRVKDEIKELLLKFHTGAFEESQLTPWERSVYDQFSRDNDGDKFLIASKRIRAQQGIKENFLAGVKRSFAYLPYIEEVLKQEGIPVELKYLPHVESSFNPVAVSHVGAAGMWQFMKRTGRLYMKVNRIKDERFDPLTSTMAAARLLKYNYDVLQDWALAITAYNHGLGSMKRAKKNYGNYLTIREKYLRRSFGFASKNFYPELLAVVEIADSIDYYFPNLEKDPLIVFQEIELPVAVSLPRFSQKFRIDKTTLAELNPGFRRHVWSGSARVPAGYTLRLPLEADSYRILTSLGASREEIDEVRLVQKTPDQEQLIITSLKDIQLKREVLKKAIAANQFGVESVFQHKYISDLNEGLFALIEEMPSPVIFEPLNATAPLAEKPPSGYQSLGKPGVEAAPDVNIASVTIPSTLPEKGELPHAALNRATPYKISNSDIITSLHGFSKPGITPFVRENEVSLLALGITEGETDTSEEVLAMYSLEGFPKPLANLPRSPAEVQDEAFEYFTGEKPEPVLFAETLFAATAVAESSVSITSFKYTVESEMAAGRKRQPTVYLTGEMVLTLSSIAGKDFSIEQATSNARLQPPAPALLSKPSVAEAPAEKSVSVVDAIAYQIDFLLPGTPLTEAVPDEPLLAEVSLAEKFDLKFYAEDSLLLAQVDTRQTENWLTGLKPRVEQDLVKVYAPVFAEESVYTNAKDGQKSPTYAASISFNKQSVETDLAQQILYKSQWGAAALSQDEVSLQEIVILLRRRLNPDQEFILVYPQETLGHFGEWLNINTHQLRRLNNLSRSSPIYTGQRLKLDFSRVSPAEFAEKRLSYHLNLILAQLEGNNRIKLMDYTIHSGENLWTLAHKRYNFPVNLLLYFNDFDKLERLYPGDVIKLPVIYN